MPESNDFQLWICNANETWELWDFYPDQAVAEQMARDLAKQNDVCTVALGRCIQKEQRA